MDNIMVKAFVLRLGILLAPLLITGCVQMTLAWADLSPDGPSAAPAILVPSSADTALSSVAAWESTRAPMVR